MGKDFLPLRMNNFNIKKAYNNLKNREIIEASEICFFNSMPKFNLIEEIELGQNGTNETILRLNNNGFVVVDGTMNLNCLKGV